MGGKASGAFIFILLGASMAAAQEPAAPQGPVSYWKFDETSGTTTANNVSGGPIGTHQGGVTIVTTGLPPLISYKNTACRSFNGTNAVIQVGNFGSFTNMSVSTWIYRTGGPASRQSIVSYKESGGGFVLSLNESNPSEYPRIWLNQGGWQNKEQGVAIPLNTWIHLAATYDAATLTLYRDGVQVATGAIAGNMTSPTANTGIGARNSWDQHWFQGLIDDVRIYQRALSTNEVQVLAAGCPTPTGLTATFATTTAILNWTAPAGVDPGYKYNVKRATVQGGYPTGTYTTIAPGISGTTYTDTITPGTNYYYVVSAVSAAESGDSNEAGPPVTALPNTGLFTTESGATTSFNVTFTSPAPAGGSTVQVVSNNTAEGVVSTTFAGATPITDGFQVVVAAGSSPTIPVTVTGVNDLVADGAQPYTVTVTASGVGFTIPTVQLTNNDNDIPGITFSKTSGLVTTEAGGTDSFSVVLNTKPVNTVTLMLTVSNTAEMTISTSVINFTPTNYNTQQVVTLTGVDDTVLDFTQPFWISGTLSPVDTMGDAAYVGMPVPTVSGVNLDDEVIPPAKGAWGGNGGCGLLGLEIGLPLLALRLRRRRRPA
jgi:hypothetical protein